VNWGVGYWVAVNCKLYFWGVPERAAQNSPYFPVLQYYKLTLKSAGLVSRIWQAPGWYVYTCIPFSLGYIGWKKYCQKRVKAYQHQCNSQSNNQCQSNIKLYAFYALPTQFSIRFIMPKLQTGARRVFGGYLHLYIPEPSWIGLGFYTTRLDPTPTVQGTRRIDPTRTHSLSKTVISLFSHFRPCQI